MSAELEQFSGQKRNPIPKNLLDLFLNDECTIDNDAEFVKNFRKKFSDIMLMKANNFREYNSWKYVLFRIYELLDKRIRELKATKSEKPSDAEQIIKTCEETIENCVTIVRLILRKIKSIFPYFFPYFGRIIEVTQNPNIIRSLIVLGELMLVRSNKNRHIITEIAPLISLITPSLRLLYHCQWDIAAVKKIISEVSLRENMTSDSNDSIFNHCLTHAKTIITAFKEEEEASEPKDKLFFLESVFSKLCEQEKITLEKDEVAYFKALGEINLASFLLNIRPNTKFLPDLCLTYIINGSCLLGIKGKNDDAYLLSLTAEPCHQNFQCPLNLSILDLITQHSRNLSNKQLSPEALGEEVETLTLYFLGLESQVLLLRFMEQVPEPGNDFEKLLKRLFYSNSGSSDTESEPLLVEVWRNCTNLYREYYSSFEDESENLFAVLTDVVKDKVNLMMWHYMLLLVVCMQQTTEDHQVGNETIQKLADEYSPAANFLVDEIIKVFENFDLEKNYVSFLTLHSMFTIFRVINSFLPSDLRLQVRIVEKMESILQWSYTPDFLACFDKVSNPEFLKNILMKTFDFIHVIVYFDDTPLSTSQEDLMAHMSTFNYIDFITNNPKVKDNPHAIQAQEKMIRAYIVSHFISQHLTAKSEDTDLFVFYTLERLEQVWKIILNNSTYQMPSVQDFAETIYIMEGLVERDQHHVRFYRIFNKDLLLTLFCDCVLKNEAEIASFDENTASAILGSLKTHNMEEYKQLLDDISQGLENAFKDFENDADTLERLYQQNDPKFMKTLFSTEIKGQEFMKRLEPFYYKCLNTTEEGTIICPEFENTLQAGLARLLVSPICYMLYNPVYLIKDHIEGRFESSMHFLRCLLPTFLEKVSETLRALVQDFQEERKSESLLTQNLARVLSRFAPSDLFMPTLSEDLKDNYRASSKLFIYMARECIDIRDEEVQECVPMIVKCLDLKIEEITELFVALRYFLRKARGGHFYVTIDFIDQYLPFEFEVVQDYFVRKTQVLINLLTKYDSSKTEEENLTYQLSAMAIYNQFVNELEVEQDLQLYQKIEGSANKIYSFLFEAVIRFTDLVSKADFETKPLQDTVEEDTTTKANKIDKETSLFRLFGFLQSVFDQKFFHRLAKDPHRDFFKDMLKVFMNYQDRLGLKLWQSLSIVKGIENWNQHISSLWTRIYLTYEGILKTILKLPELNSLFQTSGKEEPLKEDVPDPALFQYCKDVAMQLLSKYIIYFNGVEHQSLPLLAPAYFDVYKEFMDKYVKIAGQFALGIEEGCRYLDSLGQDEIVKIYKNEVMNGIRACTSAFLFFSRCQFWQPLKGEFPDLITMVDTNWIMESMKTFVRGISCLINNLKIEDVLQEDKKLVENDFLKICNNIGSALMYIAKDLLISYSDLDLDANTVLDEFNAVFHVFYDVIKMIGVVDRSTQEETSITPHLFTNSEFTFVFMVGLVYTNSFEKLSNDEEMLELLQDLPKDQFYNIAELYATQAYEADKLLPLKLKTLAQLDSSGRRLFQNHSIKAFEKYWNNELQEIWKNSFEVQECEKAKHKYSTKQIMAKGADISLDGRIQIQVDQEIISVPTLAFLKQDINRTSKNFIEYLMRSIVSKTTKQFSQFINPSDSIDYDSLNIQSQIVSLAGIIRNFPELSVIFASYKTEQIAELSSDYKDLLPISTSPENFIGFFVRYVCYLRHFAAFYFLENMVVKSETPIFVEYEGKPILLNVYNELLVFQEIFKILKETLDSPESFLKTLSSFSTWNILCVLSIRLLRTPTEPNQPNYKLQIITTLYSLCDQALEVYYKNNREQDVLQREETQFIYVMLVQLAELETFLKTKQSVDNKSNNKAKKLTRYDLRWARAVFKEDLYVRAPFNEGKIQQDPDQDEEESDTLLSLDLKLDSKEDNGTLKGYIPQFKTISKENMRGFIIEKRLNMHLYRRTNLLYICQDHEAHELVARISRFFKERKPKEDSETSEMDRIGDRVSTFLTCPPYFERSKYFTSFNLENFSLQNQRSIFNPEKQSADLKKPLRFRVLVKKALTWKEKESNPKRKVQAVAELLGKDQQEDFASLIKKMGFDKLSKLIQANKARIKLLIQQQHEKFLMAKLEALVNQQVNIEKFLGLETSVDNLAFFNEQSSLDQKLILLLSNKDFVKSLGQEAQNRSEVIKKAYYERNKKNNARGVDEEEDEEKEEEENEEYGSQNEGEGVEEKIDEEHAKEEKPGETGEDAEKLDMKIEKENGLEGEEKEENGEKEGAEGDWEDDGDDEELGEDENGDERGDWASEEGEGEGEEIEDDIEDVEMAENVDGERIEVEDMNGQNGEEVGMEIEAANGEGNLHKKLVSSARKNKKPKEEDAVSSDCHTESVFDLEGNPDSEHESNNEDDQDYNHDDEGIQDFCTLDDYNLLSKDSDETKKEIALYNHFRNRFKTIREKLSKIILAEKMTTEKPEPKANNVQVLLEDWLRRYSLIFAYSEVDKLKSSPDDPTPFQKQKIDSLVSHFALLTMLDPTREVYTIPLFALYAVGNNISLFQAWSTGPVKSKILTFLYEYILRAPSVFFQTFSFSFFKNFLQDNGENIKDETFTIFDLLLEYYLDTYEQENMDKNIQEQLQTILDILFEIWADVKEEDLPEFIKNLRQKKEKLLRDSTVHKLLALSHVLTSNVAKNKIPVIYDWLEDLAKENSYTKDILVVCCQLIRTYAREEKEVLEEFNIRAAEILQSNNQLTFGEKAYFQNFLSTLNLKVPSVLTILSYLVNEKVNEENTPDFIQAINLIKSEFKDISSSYMETLETISSLQEKKHIESITSIRGKLKEILEVPVQIHLYFSKLKEDSLPSLKLGDIGLIRSNSSQILSIRRSHSLARRDTMNFQEGMVSWLKKRGEFVNNILKISSTGVTDSDLWVVKKFPWILDFKVKEKILREAVYKVSREQADNDNNDNEYDDEDEFDRQITMFIRRDNILEDTMNQFETNQKNGVIPNFKIEFVREPGVDQGGLKKEWMTLLSKEIFDPRRGLFKLSPNMRTIHPNPLSIVQSGQSDCFKLAGTVAALAIKEQIPIDVNFSKSLLKLLLGGQPNLNDLEDIDPEMMNSLTWMLNNEVTGLEQPFIYELDVFGQKIVQELIENGSNTEIDDTNKELYISTLCEARTQKEVENQIQSFKAGFSQIIPNGLLELFSAGEIEILISGKSEIDIQDLKKYAVYKEISRENVLVQWFWEIVEIMDQDMLANLLFFITGTSKVPHGGFKDHPITLRKGPDSLMQLPIAHTCFREMEIPLYESKEQFYEKLVLAISEGKEGFYIS